MSGESHMTICHLSYISQVHEEMTMMSQTEILFYEPYV